VSNSDYSKKRTNLNDLIPTINKSKLLESINENLFNRYLTKPETIRYIGNVGDVDTSPNAIGNIQEVDEFRQENQLQPIVQHTVGSVKHFLSFQEFLKKLELTGVDVNSLDDWGKILQFNWNPPIDFDKLINYRDYFWNSPTSEPDYITIKNNLTRSTTRFQTALSSVLQITKQYEIHSTSTNSIDVEGNHTNKFSTGDYVIIGSNSGPHILSKVFSSSYSSGSQRTTINILDNVPSYEVDSIANAMLYDANVNETSITVSGNVTPLFKKGYVFSVYDSYEVLLTVESSSFDPVFNISTIVITTGQHILNPNVTVLNTTPLLFLLNGEILAHSDEQFLYSPNLWGIEDVSYFWSNDVLLHSGTNGETAIGSDNLTDNTVNFITSGISIGDIVHITSGNQIGEYKVESVYSTTLRLDKMMFDESNIEYYISRSGNILNIPLENITNRLYYVQFIDELQQYDGSTWNTVLKNASFLTTVTNSLNFNVCKQTDEWSSTNLWVHKDQIKDMTDKTRAQIPIIEFDDCLEMSQTSIATHEWDYRENSDSSYITTDISPSLFELHDVSLTIGNEFYFDGYYTIVFNEKYGNLSDGMAVGSELVFTEFVENNGVYKIANVEFVKIAISNRYVTKVTLEQALADTADFPIGGRITPRYTSLGHEFVYDQYQWRFKGVKEIKSSSLNWTRNPMLDDYVYSFSTSDYVSNVYLSAQEIKYLLPMQGPEILFDNILQNVVLYDDYQEGDIRVYINGERQYGNFSDIDGLVNDDYVGGIKFDDSVILSESDTIRIEVGEYFLEDVGRRDVLVNTSDYNLVDDYFVYSNIKEKYNLVRLRKIEQKRFQRNSYPVFSIYNDDGTASEYASEIFKYTEQSDMPVNPYIFRRIKYDYALKDFFFENKLNSENQNLYAYKRNGQLHTVWHHGIDNELTVPQTVGDVWNIIDPWYYNIEHENRKDVSLRDVFRHASSCISEQQKDIVYFSSEKSKYYLQTYPNKVLGGTIKEHNGGLDSLVSAIFTNSGTPGAIIDFAAAQYNTSLNYIKEIYRDILVSHILSDENVTYSDFVNNIILDTIDVYENNDSFNELYGDSLNTSLKNFISSATSLGIFQSKVPHLFNNENNDVCLVHHTGHLSQIIFTNAEREQIIQRLPSNTAKQTVTSSSQAFPTPTLVGQLLIRTDLQTKTRKIYKTSSTLEWFELDLLDTLSKLMLDVETKLYNDCNEYTERYDFSIVQQKELFDQKYKQQFIKFTKRFNIEYPFSIANTFKSHDSFTWNYYYTPIPEHPKTGMFDPSTFGSWQALYQYVYGTAYPHQQPWILQGYYDKPSWWDETYLNTDVNVNRYWKELMWINILSGVVPNGKLLPNESIATGTIGEIEEVFLFLPVNMLDVPTNDGYEPDELLPPYWNSSNIANSNIRTLFDINSGYGVNTPNLDYEFGQNGTYEWVWKNSIWHNYDLMTISYKLDPITFFNAVFDSKFNVIDCLQIDERMHKVRNHNITVFHGELIDNEIYKSDGTNQWYVFFNRYNSLDGNAAAFKDTWNNWQQKLSYLFSGMIDTNNLEIFNYNFDITDKDYSLDIDKTVSFDKKQMTGLNAKLLSVPSKYSKSRDTGIGWTTEFSPLGLEETIDVYRPQAFDFYADVSNNLFVAGKYKLLAASIAVPVGFQNIDFSQTVFNSLNTGLSNSNFNYHASVLVDGATNIPLVIKGHKAQTFTSLLTEINSQLSTFAVASIYYGDIRIQSANTGIGSAISITDSGLFSSINGFSAFMSPDTISYEFLKIFEIYKNLVRDFQPGSQFTIADSTQFNGTYDVLNSYFDVQSQTTKIFVSNNILVSSDIVDGYIIPENIRTIPEEWTNGTELFAETNGILPNPLDPFTPYYFIRVDDYSFRLSNSQKGAQNGSYVPITSVGSGAHVIGKMDRTFKALSGSITNYPWRVYQSDRRNVVTENLPFQTSGIQDAVNFLMGYNDKLYDDGIIFSNKDADNKDNIDNRTNDWQYFTEKFISWAYQIRAIKQEDTLRFEVQANITDNTLDIQNGAYVNWPNGTEVVFSLENGVTLPTPFNNPLSEYIPYYVIRTTSNTKVQLALSTYDALRGKAIDITDTGVGKFYIRTANAITDYPVFTLNPCKHTVFINHPQGVISDIFNRTDYFFSETPQVYDIYGESLNNRQLLMYRNDKETKLRLVEDIIEKNSKQFIYNKKINENDILYTSVTLNNDIIEIGGFKLFLDGYEHIVSFNDSSVDDSLIFDKFLGLRTPRFYMEYSRTPDFTLRPNVGGHVLQNGKLVENIEHSVESLRYLFDAYTSIENRPIIERSRKSIGYDGPKDYMDDLQINDKTQFLFWRGMIQNKGTNMSIDAFVNQPVFLEAGVDEFWAYRVACFGDSKEKVYPELKLFTRDVSTKEMRVEFVTPDGGALNDTFEPIKLTDLNRWWNQPDQLYMLSPKPSFYFDAQVTSVSYNVESEANISTEFNGVTKNTEISESFTPAEPISTVNGRYVFELPKKSDKVIVTYFDTVTETTKQLSEGYDYFLINTGAIEFTDITGLVNITVATLSYNYDAQNPATLLDKKSDVVMKRIPIWHPAIDQHYHVSDFVIDIRSNIDRAVYNYENVSATETSWLKNKEHTVWLDTSKMYYIPYYDAKIFPDINYRIFNWGRMADFGSITMYQWTESLVPPEQWESVVISDSNNKNLLQNDKRSGEAYYIVYRNIEEETGMPPNWVENKDEIFEFTTKLVQADTIVENTINVEPKVYINGFFVGTFDIEVNSLYEYCYGPLLDGQTSKPRPQDIITLVFESHIPSQDELDAGGIYKKVYPYSYVTKVDPLSHQEYNVYYFWVKNKENKIAVTGDSFINLKEAQKQMQFIPVPYMILQGLRTPEFGYGLVYGIVFDEDEYELPYRYTQLVIKGLENTVKDDERYVLRFTRDFTLRDELPGPNSLYSPLYLKNVHWEWKLIREKQLAKIDLFLWDRIIECMIGKRIISGIVDNTNPLPTLNRTVYDSIYDRDTRYGLGEEQIFMDGELAKYIVNYMLNDPNNTFINVDINEFITNNTLDSESNIISTMYAIYNNFTTEEINKIFFELLHAAMTHKKHHSEIFKTSWVALQSTINVSSPSNGVIRLQNFIDGECPS